MSKREKRLQKIRQNPRDVSMSELEQVLKDYGAWLDRSDGSHHIFSYNIKGREDSLSIPFARPIKSRYVKLVIEIIDQIREEENRD